MSSAIGQDDRELVEGFWKDYVDGYIMRDLYYCIHAGANYLVALGEMCYVEFLGKLMTGKESPTDNFMTFVRGYLPRYDPKTDPTFLGKLYGEVRSGLVHSYFPENVNVIAREKASHGPPSIWQEKDGRWMISVADFMTEFKGAADALKADLLAGKYLKEFKIAVSENPGLERISRWPVGGASMASTTTTTYMSGGVIYPPPKSLEE